MIKKCIVYQKMLNCNLENNTNPKELGVVAVVVGLSPAILGTVTDVLSGVCIYDANFATYFFLAFCLIGALMTSAQVSSRMMQSIPVSDRFAVASVMFGIPVSFGGALFAVFLMVGGLFVILVERGFSWISYIREMNIAGGIFSFMIAMGMWFWVCFGAFHRNPKLRKIWYGAELLAGLAVIILLSHILQAKGISVKYSLSDLVWVFPMLPTMAVGATFVIASGIITWKSNLELYRADGKGQVQNIRDEMNEQYMVRTGTRLSQTGKRSNRILIVLGLAFCLIPILFVFNMLGLAGNSQKVNIVTSNPAEYGKWASYGEEIGLDRDILDWNEEIIFPENMDVSYIDEYYVKIDGSFEASEKAAWYSISKLRFIVATFPDGEYRKEKQRIASLSVTCDDEDVVREGDTNYILHDTEHFSAEAYIAAYEPGVQYEYALTDDEIHQIIYILADDASLEAVPTAKDFQSRAFVRVISLYQANIGRKGFSVYSFQ